MVNLVSCICKKSLSVTKKVLKYGGIACGLLSIIAILIYGLWSIRDIIVSIWNSCMGWVVLVLSDIWLLLCSIPWFVYVIIAIPTCIIIYSTFWCILKNYPDGKLAIFIYEYNFRWIYSLAMLIWGIIISILLYVFLIKDIVFLPALFSVWIIVICVSLLSLLGAFD